MPTKPQIVASPLNGFQVLNTIRANASEDYQNRIPTATQENIRNIGQTIMSYSPARNEFLDALFNRIGRVIITSKMYTNPYKIFKRGQLEYGESVEELFVNITKAKQFDPVDAETTLFKRNIPDVRSAFHKKNRENYYDVNVSHDMLKTAFLSGQGILDLIAKIVTSLYTSAENDEFLLMKQLLVQAVNDGAIYPVNVPEPDITDYTFKQIAGIMRGTSNILEFMSSDYNSAGVVTFSKKEDQIVIIDAKFSGMFDVEVLASAFNMEKAEFMGNRILIDNFSELSGVLAMVVDRDFFMVFDNLIEYTDVYNAKGLNWNYFLHIWQTYSYSPFANAVMYVTSTSEVTSVTVSPTTASLNRGQSTTFTPTVTVSGYAPKSVSYALTGGENVTSTVDSKGKVTIGQNEINTTLTLTVTSTFDDTKSATAVITVNPLP